MTIPPTMPAAPPLGSEGQRCSNCDALLSPDQRYCLDCGRRRTSMRLPFAEIVAADVAAGTGAPRAEGRADRSPLVALGSLIALLLALGIGVLLGRGASSDPPPAARAAVVTVSAPAATAVAAPAAIVGDWPAGREAFTISLRAMPSSTPPADVIQAKADAVARGAAGAGVLISDEHPSLTPAQFVVFSGSYPTRAKATSALEGLRASFPDASVVHVADAPAGTASSSAGSAGAGAAAKGSAGRGATSGYGKATKKAPEKVVTPGKPPPVDDKAPGGGSGAATEIG